MILMIQMPLDAQLLVLQLFFQLLLQWNNILDASALHNVHSLITLPYTNPYDIHSPKWKASFIDDIHQSHYRSYDKCKRFSLTSGLLCFWPKWDHLQANVKKWDLKGQTKRSI